MRTRNGNSVETLRLVPLVPFSLAALHVRFTGISSNVSPRKYLGPSRRERKVLIEAKNAIFFYPKQSIRSDEKVEEGIFSFFSPKLHCKL